MVCSLFNTIVIIKMTNITKILRKLNFTICAMGRRLLSMITKITCYFLNIITIKLVSIIHIWFIILCFIMAYSTREKFLTYWALNRTFSLVVFASILFISLIYQSINITKFPIKKVLYLIKHFIIYKCLTLITPEWIVSKSYWNI